MNTLNCIRRLGVALAAAGVALAAPGVLAQAYPTKPIELVVHTNTNS